MGRDMGMVKQGSRAARVGIVLLITGLIATPVLAFDPSHLPQTCKDTLARMQADKARFSELGKLMTQYRKASDTKNFCEAAKQTVDIIKGQSGSLDACIGELGAAPTVPQGTADQMIQLGTVYKQMLEAAKDPKNDRMKCGLAD